MIELGEVACSWKHSLQPSGSLLAERLSTSQERSFFIEFVILTFCVMTEVCVLEDILSFSFPGPQLPDGAPVQRVSGDEGEVSSVPSPASLSDIPSPQHVDNGR